MLVLAIAVVMALLTATLWALPDAELRQSRQALDDYATANFMETLPDSCHGWLQSDHWVAIRGRSSSAQFERLCFAARESQDRAGVRSWGLATPPQPHQWLTAPLLFPDLLSMVVGLWLLAAVAGQLLERQRGRAELAVVLAVGALVPALAWSAIAGEAALPWLGGAALVSSTVAAAATGLPALQQRFWLPVSPGVLELPMWSLLGWWMLVRLLAVALFSMERSALAAEMLAVVGGAAAGVVLRLGITGAVQRVLDQGKAQLRAAASPVPVGPPVVPGPARGGMAPPAFARQVPDTDETVHELEETLDSAEDEALAALFSEDPAPAPVATAVPLPAKGLAERQIPAAAAALPFGGFGDPKVPDSVGLDFDALLGAMAAPAPQPTSLAPAGAPGFAPLGFAPVAAAAPLAADSEQTSVVPTEPSSMWVPPRLAQGTRAYAGSTGEAIRAAIEQAQQAQRLPPRVRLSNAVRRDPHGNLQCWLEGQWEGLPADLIQGVAVGLVEHSNFPDAQPEIWIDVILERDGPERRAEVLRIHLSREALLQFSPDRSGSLAFAALAEEIASVGALRLPQRPVWPGPPWPRYATAAEFVSMWQQELG